LNTKPIRTLTLQRLLIFFHILSAAIYASTVYSPFPCRSRLAFL
ncbi:hypothetical protein LCGC14_2691840, partial [marine sediment metagenome]